MKILSNMRKAFGLALAFALALSLSAPAQGQSVLNQIGKRAKNAVKTRTTMGADRAIQKTLDKAENAIEKGVTNAGRGRSGKGHAPTVGKGSAAGGGAVAGNGSVAGNDEEQKGQPAGVETTKMNPIGSKGMGGADLSNLETYTKETCILYLNNSNVDLTVHDCAFINAPNHVILGLFKGSLTIDNNIFVNCRMEAMDARGSDPKENSRIDFTNNTVLFMWSFKQNLETMGYGFRFQPGTDCYLANNIFGCSMFTALDYTHIDSDKNREATRNTVVENNVFFLNRMGDLSIPGGGNFINISSADFSDVEYIDSESGNTTVQDANIFKGKIDEAYLKGFLNASYTAEMQHNPNSAVNTFRSALGMNQIGTMTSKVTMYANRYNWEKALLLFGAMPGYGAQMPK